MDSNPKRDGWRKIASRKERSEQKAQLTRREQEWNINRSIAIWNCFPASTSARHKFPSFLRSLERFNFRLLCSLQLFKLLFSTCSINYVQLGVDKFKIIPLSCDTLHESFAVDLIKEMWWVLLANAFCICSLSLQVRIAVASESFERCGSKTVDEIEIVLVSLMFWFNTLLSSYCNQSNPWHLE